VRWHDRSNESSSGSASRLVHASSPRSRRNRWNGSSCVSEILREGPRASASRRQWKSWLSMRGWRGYFRFCETPVALIALTRSVRLRAASLAPWKTSEGRERHSSHWESRETCATRPVAAVDPGISPGASPLGGTLQRLQIARSAVPDRSTLAQLLEPWRGRGGAARLPLS
jgi:hypothetical protein